jgi:spermidine synthase
MTSPRYEATDQDGNSIGFRYHRVLVQERTQYQEIQILESAQWGKVLLLDGEVQSSSVDEALMNEIRAHVPFYSFSPEKIREGISVLLVGGGNGSTLQELLKHEQIKLVDLVEIDSRVIELCSIHIPESNQGGKIFQNSRVNVCLAEGYQFLKEQSDKRYDLIIVDCTNPDSGDSLSGSFYHEDFFQIAKSRLSPAGILTIPTGVPTVQGSLVQRVLTAARKHFLQAGFMKAHVPTFGLGQWTVVWATNGMGLNENVNFRENFRLFPVATNIYNPNAHFSSLHHDKWLQNLERQKNHE